MVDKAVPDRSIEQQILKNRGVCAHEFAWLSATYSTIQFQSHMFSFVALNLLFKAKGRIDGKKTNNDII